MLYKTISASVFGIDAYPVQVEVDVGSAYLKDFHVVGLPDNAVKESRERVKAAMRNCGFEFPYDQGIYLRRRNFYMVSTFLMARRANGAVASRSRIPAPRSDARAAWQAWPPARTARPVAW